MSHNYSKLYLQQSKLSLHDNLVLLHKLISKQRIVQENIATMNRNACIGIPEMHGDNAATSQAEISSATIPPQHFPIAQISPLPSLASAPLSATWQWLRGYIYLFF